MKTGTPSLQNKPVMSARPPVRSAESLLDDLDKVAVITEEPSRAAAQVLGEAKEVAANQVGQKTPRQPKEKPAAKGRAPTPWEELEGVTVTQQTNFKLPVQLLAKLKFLSETTYGETQTSIVRRAVEEAVAKMLKERGLS